MDPLQPLSDSRPESVILLVVSGGVSDFVQNTLISIRRSGAANNTVCIAAPEAALREIETAISDVDNVKYCTLEEVCRKDYSCMGKYQRYGSELFGRFTASKCAAIRFLLQSGIARVIYTDVDIAWIRNPVPLVDQVLDAFDIAIQTEGIGRFPPQYCTGFMCVRNSEFAVELLDRLERTHLETLEAEPKVDDQIVFNRVVANSRDVMHRIFCLSELLFANGLSAGLIMAQNDDISALVASRARQMIFHANWTAGLPNKRLLLQRTGNWFVGP
jgi:hypothetical protein